MIEIKRKRQTEAGGDKYNGKTGESSAEMQTVPQRPKPPFTAPTDPARDYRAMYSELFRFHERYNNPPDQISEDRYWNSVNDEMGELARKFNDDVFMTDMINTVFEELERQWIERESRKRAASP